MVDRGCKSYTVRKCHFEFELSVLPDCLVFTWDGTFPFLEIEDAGGCAHRPCDEAERVVFPPLFSEMSVRRVPFLVVWEVETYRSSFSRFWQRLMVASCEVTARWVAVD